MILPIPRAPHNRALVAWKAARTKRSVVLEEHIAQTIDAFDAATSPRD